MKLRLKIGLALLATLLSITAHNASAATYYGPRGSVWGLAGTENQGRLDLLLPITSNADNLFYTDVQGAYAQDDGSFGGIGAGFRKLINNSAIYGGYLFIDRDESTLHNEFTVLSPGAEAIFPRWDFRLNGYFPVSEHSKTVEVFPSQLGDCRYVVFQGHQQFENQFSVLEQAGPGADTEVGYTFHQLRNAQVHAGVYYFNFNAPNNTWGAQNTKNVTGVEGRLEVPVNPHWAVTVVSSYDNYQHGAIMGGLRFNFAGAPPIRPYNLQDRMVDPVTRNMDSLSTGTGVPTVTSRKNNGLVLERDNIYFFTSQGGSPFVNKVQSGTFENPLRNDQFSQSVVNQIGTNANLYFNTGSYLIMGNGTVPNAQIDIPFGDSIYGRSLGFKCPAVGDARPILFGSLNLNAGNNTIDSIQLINRMTDSTGAGSQVVALNILNANNIVLSNDNVQAIATETADLTGNNFAAAIYANNSSVRILNSTVASTASVNGAIAGFGLNFATGMGGNNSGGNTDFNNNNFVIVNSNISGSAVVQGNDTIENFATGIGGNSSLGNSNFNHNIFTLTNSNVSGVALVGGNNTNNGFNFATGIGGNDESTDTPGFSAAFNNNTFTLNNTNVSGTASIAGNNLGGFNAAAGIGGNNGIGNADFNTNIFTLTNSKATGSALVTGNNSNSFNFATGIGGNTDLGASNLGFINNTFTLTNSSATGLATVDMANSRTSIFFNNDNFATGIGENSFVTSTTPGSANFAGNTFILTNSTASATASVGGNNVGTPIIPSNNAATGIGRNNDGDGSSDFSNNTFTITGSTINSSALINGTNSSNNLALGLNMSAAGNIIKIDQSTINVLAAIGGNNTGFNTATGLSASTGSTIRISNSVVNVTAQANGTNQAIGTNGGGTFVISNTPFNLTPP